MVAEIFYPSVCACGGLRFPHNDMQIGLKDTTNLNILKMLISLCETKTINRPSRICLSTSSNDYVIMLLCYFVNMLYLCYYVTVENRFLTFVIFVINL